MDHSLFAFLADEITEACDTEIVHFAKNIAETCRKKPLGVLFYGSQTKNLDENGLIDFYLIVEKLEDFPQTKFALWGNKILPPNIYFRQFQGKRAKLAVMSLEQMQKRTSFKSFDTTIWARFSQPVYLVWVRNEAAKSLLIKEIMASFSTAARWGAFLGPLEGTAKTYLETIYTQTFKAEIRVENISRITALIKRNLSRYTICLPLIWRVENIPFWKEGEILHPMISENQRSSLKRRWQFIKFFGKTQNLLRLLKAAATFNGGADYLRWKVRRHTGIVISASPYEKKYPIIEIPMTFIKIIFSLSVKKWKI